ncbi:helix-turn-helix domain-containing protein [Qipengyuania xiapuensis]|uniref:Helix-turn-helix domain-containing protein n=1 Tax=Qipengyuania xiapuensis TaxID=2867236 RepID=A0ABX8ZRB6_9SPHN|nr:helix-turn-helix domain-containing protein [Qipengyuania xiapuensis]QZD91553.1 helix-turn-helix domain-containing protein [Qipengyuania xiapuensis]
MTTNPSNGADAAEPYSFEWVEAPEDIARYLNSLYILRTGPQGVDDMMPAYSGQLLVTVRGGGVMHFGDGRDQRTLPAYIQCPLTEARKFEIDANSVMLGVSLNFRGWAALTGLPVNENHDDYRLIEDVLPHEIAARIAAVGPRVNAGEITERQALDELADIVRDGFNELPERQAQVIDTTLDWLSASFKPEIETLLDRLPYSERQVQRLVTQFFGAPPVRLIRRYRAMRAATLLAMPDLDPALEAEIRDAFYDQAHMIKEIRHFTGRTPRRLMPKEHSVIKDTLAPDGYSSVDLFGGNQDQELAKE